MSNELNLRKSKYDYIQKQCKKNEKNIFHPQSMITTTGLYYRKLKNVVYDPFEKYI